MVSSQVEPIRTSTKLAEQNAVKVFGVGRTGIRILHRLFGQKVRDVDYVALFTDQFHSEGLNGPHKVQIGKEATGGVGSAGDPYRGAMAAEESKTELQQLLQGTELLIVTAGLGGGTGSGAASYIASLAKESGASVMAAVTTPYGFEAQQRRDTASDALADLKDTADTVVVVSLEKIMEVGELDENEALERAYSILDEGIQNVLRSAGPAASKGRFGTVSAMLSLAALR